MSSMECLKPVNRHFLIVPHVKDKETNSGVLLPDDYKPEQDRYIEASVVAIASDCDKQFIDLKYGLSDTNRVVVDRTMIQEINLKNRKHYMILENYVVGIYRVISEN